MFIDPFAHSLSHSQALNKFTLILPLTGVVERATRTAHAILASFLFLLFIFYFLQKLRKTITRNIHTRVYYIYIHKHKSKRRFHTQSYRFALIQLVSHSNIDCGMMRSIENTIHCGCVSAFLFDIYWYHYLKNLCAVILCAVSADVFLCVCFFFC